MPELATGMIADQILGMLEQFKEAVKGIVFSRTFKDAKGKKQEFKTSTKKANLNPEWEGKDGGPFTKFVGGPFCIGDVRQKIESLGSIRRWIKGSRDSKSRSYGVGMMDGTPG